MSLTIFLYSFLTSLSSRLCSIISIELRLLINNPWRSDHSGECYDDLSVQKATPSLLFLIKIITTGNWDLNFAKFLPVKEYCICWWERDSSEDILRAQGQAYCSAVASKLGGWRREYGWVSTGRWRAQFHWARRGALAGLLSKKYWWMLLTTRIFYN